MKQIILNVTTTDEGKTSLILKTESGAKVIADLEVQGTITDKKFFEDLESLVNEYRGE